MPASSSVVVAVRKHPDFSNVGEISAMPGCSNYESTHCTPGRTGPTG